MTTPAINLPAHILRQGPLVKTDRSDDQLGPYDLDRVTEFARNRWDLNSFLAEYPDFNLSSYGRCGSTVLGVALQNNSTEQVTTLLNRDPSLINKSWANSIPYFCTAACTSIKLVKIFTSRKANVNIVSATGETPLSYASFYNQRDTIKFLLVRGAVLYQQPLTAVLNDTSWAEETRSNVAAQPARILAAIAEIRKEHTATTNNPLWLFRVKKMPVFPRHVALHILSFASETYFLHHRFVKQLDNPSKTTS